MSMNAIPDTRLFLGSSKRSQNRSQSGIVNGFGLAAVQLYVELPGSPLRGPSLGAMVGAWLPYLLRPLRRRVSTAETEPLI